MEASKCRVCGSAHWNNEPHIFKSGQDTNKKIAGPVAKIKEKFDRIAYQREYMREYRKRKAKGEAR